MRAARAATRSISRASTTGGGRFSSGVAGALARGACRGVRGERLDARDRAGFVDEVDRAVGQPVVAQMPRRQLRGRLERRIRVADAVMLFVAAAQPGENLHRLVDGRLVDGDLLQAPRQRAILLDVLELLERRRANHAQIARREQRLEQRREIHRAAGDRAGADGGVHFVDEENRLRPGGERGDDGLEALLEVAAKPRARQQRAGIERKDFRVLQRSLHIVVKQPRGEAFGHRGLADAGFADEHRIVLAAAAEHFDRPLELVGAADQRIEQPLPRAFGQVHAVRLQRIGRRRRGRRLRRRPSARWSMDGRRGPAASS